jgi:Coenzyme PQQ synthesis protein D (PqqD)
MTELSLRHEPQPDKGYVRGSFRFARDERVLWRENIGSVILLPPDGDQVVTLRGGHYIWELLDQPTSEPELVQRVAEHFSAPADTIRSDLVRVLRQLVKHGILRSVESP